MHAGAIFSGSRRNTLGCPAGEVEQRKKDVHMQDPITALCAGSIIGLAIVITFY